MRWKSWKQLQQRSVIRVMDGKKDHADLNFCYPVEVSRLQNPKLRLVPFDVSNTIILP
jgi:hypothetical protein